MRIGSTIYKYEIAISKKDKEVLGSINNLGLLLSMLTLLAFDIILKKEIIK